MKAFFEIKDNSVAASAPERATVVVYAAPDDKEKQELIEALDFTMHDIDSALDPDEISRVEYTPDYTYIIWKRPNSVSFEQQLKFEVSSVGLVPPVREAPPVGEAPPVDWLPHTTSRREPLSAPKASRSCRHPLEYWT